MIKDQRPDRHALERQHRGPDPRRGRPPRRAPYGRRGGRWVYYASTIPCYTILYYTTLYYTILHYTTLHYTTLHYTTLHYY